MANFLALVLEAIRKRSIGSTDALCSILAAFDLGYGARVPAMGPDMLFQLKEMLMVVLPPLNQVHETLVDTCSCWCRSNAYLTRVLARARRHDSRF